MCGVHRGAEERRDTHQSNPTTSLEVRRARAASSAAASPTHTMSTPSGSRHTGWGKGGSWSPLCSIQEHTHTHTHTGAHAHKHTHTHTRARAHTHGCARTQTHTRAHTHNITVCCADTSFQLHTRGHKHKHRAPPCVRVGALRTAASVPYSKACSSAADKGTTATPSTSSLCWDANRRRSREVGGSRDLRHSASRGRGAHSEEGNKPLNKRLSKRFSTQLELSWLQREQAHRPADCARKNRMRCASCMAPYSHPALSPSP